MKKAQVTIFIIIGIILLLAISVAVYFYSKTAKQPFDETLPQVSEPQDFDPQFVVESCLAKSGRQAVYTSAKQGGYLNPKGDYRYNEPGDMQPIHYYTEDSVVPYVVDGNKVSMRSFNDSLNLLSNYVAVEVNDCIQFTNNIKVYKPNIDWQEISFDWDNALVDYSNMNVKIEFLPTIDKEHLILDAVYPVKVESKDYFKEVSTFAIDFPLRYEMLYNISEKLAHMIAQSDTFDISEHCQEISSHDQKVNVYVSENLHRQAYVVAVVDSSPVEQGLSPLRFQFAVRNVEVVGGCFG